ncbi:hypothetical protein SCHPADRAFT_887757 [Schizopora paradoxa]|uniref:Uncharacterized protein n=1 Tax=Schizopora paradoxa TaxID=27342 RepID=A0A0H2SH86_9AGAM|nr:hypothetical protein SCHPADRAFT_887757 [Schizopora paradoxa]
MLASDHTVIYALIGSVMMDSLALCLLLYKSVLHTKVVKNTGLQKMGLLQVMAQDGMMYFLFNIEKCENSFDIFPRQVCTIATTIFLERASTARTHGVGMSTISKIHSNIRFADFEMTSVEFKLALILYLKLTRRRGRNEDKNYSITLRGSRDLGNVKDKMQLALSTFDVVYSAHLVSYTMTAIEKKGEILNLV